MAAIASGASPEIKPNAEEVASWYTPIEACAYAAQIFGPEKASDAIWERLVGGMIEAVATATSIMYGDDSPATTREPTFIPRFYWRHISNKGTDIWGALSAAARSLSLATVARMSDQEAWTAFRLIRWSDTKGEPVCPRCGCLDSYTYKTRKVFRCKGCSH
jgi:Transposase zinc-ribbon domain